MRWLAENMTLWIKPRHMPLVGFAVFTLLLLSVLLPAEPWAWRTALLPAIVTASGIVLALIEIAVSRFRFLHKNFAARSVLDIGFDTDLPESTVNARSNFAILWLIAVIAGIVLVGFHIAVPIFLVVYLRIMAHATCLSTAGYAGFVWFVIFVVFENMMEVRWPMPLLNLS